MDHQVAGAQLGAIFEVDERAAAGAAHLVLLGHDAVDQNQVVSTGGGAFVNLENRAKLRTGNLVIHLQVRPETVVDRLRNSKSGRPRPLLDSPDPLERVVELMAARKEAYSAAHVPISLH